MAKNVTVGAHSCVIIAEVKDAGPRMGDKYGRMFPGLSPCEADEAAVIDLGRGSSRMDATLPVVDEGLENRRIPAGFAILGLLDADPGSYRNVYPGWRPKLPAAGDGFAMAGLLAFATESSP